MHTHRSAQCSATPLEDLENGFTLIEVLVAVVILGLTFAAVLGGMATSINTSDAHRKQEEVQAVLVSAAERVRSPATPAVSCDKTEQQFENAVVQTYQAAARASAPQSWTPAQVEAGITVDYKTITFSDGTGDWVSQETCSGYGPDQRKLLNVQKITVRIVHPRGRETDELTFLKGVR